MGVAHAESEEEPARVRIGKGLVRLGCRALPDADDPGDDADAAGGVKEVGCQFEAVRAVQEPQRACSRTISRPPGRRTRRASASARSGSVTVHSTWVNTTASKLASGWRSISAASPVSSAGTGGLGGQPPAHRGVGLGGHHEAGGAEMRQVRPGPRAHVEHLTGQVREQADPPFPEHSMFQRAGHPVIEGGEQPVLPHRAAGPRPG